VSTFVCVAIQYVWVIHLWRVGEVGQFLPGFFHVFDEGQFDCCNSAKGIHHGDDTLARSAAILPAATHLLWLRASPMIGFVVSLDFATRSIHDGEGWNVAGIIRQAQFA